MACILFLNIPAHGHTNPTLPLVRELTRRGHRVIYYQAEMFREKIEAAGAQLIAIDRYIPPAPKNLDRKAGKDFAALIEMVADTTLALEDRFAADVAAFRPDCVVADSVCFYGKLLAKKHGLPFVCSTTTLAFNEHTARLMKQGAGEVLRMMIGMPRIQKKMALLRAHGYDVSSFVSIVQNDNETNTIVYTSRLFQPMAHTFDAHYAFVGPSVLHTYPRRSHARPQIYISLGTVLHHAPAFYRRCMQALGNLDWNVILSVGESVSLSQLGPIPENFAVYPHVNQLEVLAGTDVFLTHCGMNSVSESLLCGVPMVLFPQHSEEYAVANRTKELGAGIMLGRPTARNIRSAIETVLSCPAYLQAAARIRDDFAACGGAPGAADFIEQVFSRNSLFT